MSTGSSPPVLSKIFVMLSACQMVTLLSLIMVLLNDYNRPPLQCLMSHHEKAIETYCYIQSTFTFRGLPQNNWELYPGVGPVTNGSHEKTSHKYFFWMPYLLTMQALFFGLPRHLWRGIEGNLVRELIIPQGDQAKKSAQYFVTTLSYHKTRAIKFLLCEGLGVAFIGANIWLSNWYLDGRFITAIPHLLFDATNLNKMDAIYDHIFPKVSKCSFHMFGPSGTIESKDALCILARNLLSGRIYTLLFLVFFTAVLVSTLSFALRVAVFVSPRLRLFFLLKKLPNPEGAKDDIEQIIRFCDYGDWFLLFQLSCAMQNFNNWLKEVNNELLEMKKKSLLYSLQIESM